MKAIVTHYKIDNTLNTTGDDFVFIHVFFRTETLSELVMPVMFSLDDLFNFVFTLDEAKGKYLKGIRNNIRGYGPKHSQVLDTLHEEQFDLEPYIFQFVEQKDEVYIEDHIKWCERIKLPENQKMIKKSAEQIFKLVNNDFINNQLTLNDFQDDVDQMLHELTMKYFPSLFDMDSKNLAAYKDLLVRTTQNFSEGIDRIMHNKFNDYFEEKYNRMNKNA